MSQIGYVDRRISNKCVWQKLLNYVWNPGMFILNNQSLWGFEVFIKNSYCKWFTNLHDYTLFAGIMMILGSKTMITDKNTRTSVVVSPSDHWLLPTAAYMMLTVAMKEINLELKQPRRTLSWQHAQTCVESVNIWPLTKKAKPGSRWQGEERCRRSVVWM